MLEEEVLPRETSGGQLRVRAARHLRTLRASGLLTSTRDGEQVWHTITPLGRTLLSWPRPVPAAADTDTWPLNRGSRLLTGDFLAVPRST